MDTLTIGWEYLTGYSVATDSTDRERVEWPPHPARVYMALAAAWFETGEEESEGRALQWLEEIRGQPELQLPPARPSAERSGITVYVPVNDKAGPSAASLQSAPALTRSKQPRCFPRIWLGYHPCYLHWREAPGVDDHIEALDRLCQKVTRVGHSSSLVRMWTDTGAPPPKGETESWTPDETLSETQLRHISPGMLEMLTECYGADRRRRHAELSERITSLTVRRKETKGKGAKERKTAIDNELAELEQELASTAPRPPVRPTIGLWSGYRSAGQPQVTANVTASHFDTDVLVLTHVEGPQLPIVSTLAVTHALHNLVLKHSCTGDHPVPPWVSGHQDNGDPLRDEQGHLAFMPLPFVGHEYADAHLLGVGLVFPRSVERRERGRALGPLLIDEHATSKLVKLTLGRLGTWVLRKRDWTEPRRALQPETWTAHPNGVQTWASVTPVVLDRFPKEDRVNGREAWSREVAEIVGQACVRIGLPRPTGIDIDTTSWHLGSPQAVGKHRRLRGQQPNISDRGAALGDGFPAYPAKGTGASRPQVHVWLQFAEPVVGPILLGAGRYRGYGLLMPWKGGNR
jgi:CRISPR-associated protein Csb2